LRRAIVVPGINADRNQTVVLKGSLLNVTEYQKKLVANRRLVVSLLVRPVTMLRNRIVVGLSLNVYSV